ncbi:type II secretion system F family protein [Pikeienuella piscinae]|uniref:Type II secretion system F family protein n=1 Tax=Pikeienuella piscinae TaxID=2748098 RepID=A0A7M3T5E0_9RHOB|nr:type II secretion system F family protein [Pikeienuella piscinae]QIE57221.1 type II secretion system F family protein [Pikeienuella piscinae]
MRAFFDLAWDRAVDLLGPSGPFYAIAALGLILALTALAILFRRPVDPLARLDRLDGGEEPSELSGGAESLRLDREKVRFEALAPYLEPSDEGQLSEVRARLLRAGYRSRSAVRVFYLTRAALTVGMVTFVLLVISIAQPQPDPVRLVVASSLAGIFGYLAPPWWIARQRQRRQGELADGFPDALDLMLVCVEAGQSLDQSILRVSSEIRQSHGALAEELHIIATEMRAGKDRAQVLRDFADRAGVSDISAFVTVLVQSATYGTSVSSALRIYAAEMRDKRLMRAEEKANTLPTKLTLGTMFFTVPPLMLILIGPSVIEILRALANFNSR